MMIGALGAVSKDTERWLAEIGVKCCMGIIAESVPTGYSQTWTPKVTGGNWMFKEDASKSSRSYL